VPVKTAEQQASQLLHRGREQLVRQRTMLVNALRYAAAVSTNLFGTRTHSGHGRPAPIEQNKARLATHSFRPPRRHRQAEYRGTSKY
jgi:transposase